MHRSRPVRPLALLSAIGLTALLSLDAGCGGAATRYRDPVAVTPTRDDDAAALTERQVAEVRELDRRLARGEVVCEDACTLASRICELEARICAIAARHEDDEETGARCDDATVRCAEAGTRVRERCSCE